ncbi:selenocysteine-specific translation elongation factor [Arsenophonus sp. PmNCSU2021_1]|uniref:selenocysteine-specific translation elongation factor n=1 Tax=Arsenophonus sp. PmNCSU2021_1 TaxID=3118989 RepID=UPI002FF42777
MIFATSGHVDHGKTALIQAVTGINTLHLPEEKKRGMTIDLGFAYWPQADGRLIGFIDVPGHEKFLANMLAGIGGISHILLIVACDDGIMTQTKEHLAILRLIGRPQITTILTKADRVSVERIQTVQTEISQLLTEYGWPQSLCFVTSTLTGEGIPLLRSHLQMLHGQAGQHAKLGHRFRLAIDRVFNVKGTGLVVTGTALSGQVSVGDTLWLTGINKQVKIRRLHAQNQLVSQAQAGDRIALNLTGDISKKQISRGDWLLSEQPAFAVNKVLVEVETNECLKNWQPLHLYHAASHVTGRIALLNQPPDKPLLAELSLDTPLWLVDNDRLILRDISAQRTLAGARVVKLHSPRRGKRQAEFLSWLSQLANITGDKENLAFQLPTGELSLRDYGWARQLAHSSLQALVSQFDVLIVNDIAFSQINVQQAKQHLMQILADYHQHHADQLGVGRARLKRMALPGLNDELVFSLLRQLVDEKKLMQTNGWLHLAEHSLVFDQQQEQLWQKLEPCFVANQPWWVRELAVKIQQDDAIIRHLLRKAANLGLITAIVPDRYYHNLQIQQFAAIIRHYNHLEGAITVANFRDELAIGRKLAVQILEFFDRSGFTRRKFNAHILRDQGLFE